MLIFTVSLEIVGLPFCFIVLSNKIAGYYNDTAVNCCDVIHTSRRYTSLTPKTTEWIVFWIFVTVRRP